MVVYLISAEFNGNTLYKIGHTRRKVETRVKEFKTGNASNFEIIERFESKWATKIESSLHRYFCTKKVNGEWFDLDYEDVSKFKSMCETTHNSLEVISKYNTYIIDKGGL